MSYSANLAIKAEMLLLEGGTKPTTSIICKIIATYSSLIYPTMLLLWHCKL